MGEALFIVGDSYLTELCLFRMMVASTLSTRTTKSLSLASAEAARPRVIFQVSDSRS